MNIEQTLGKDGLNYDQHMDHASLLCFLSKVWKVANLSLSNDDDWARLFISSVLLRLCILCSFFTFVYFLFFYHS